jgi:hypothetical protein
MKKWKKHIIFILVTILAVFSAVAVSKAAKPRINKVVFNVMSMVAEKQFYSLFGNNSLYRSNLALRESQDYSHKTPFDWHKMKWYEDYEEEESDKYLEYYQLNEYLKDPNEWPGDDPNEQPEEGPNDDPDKDVNDSWWLDDMS